jgi:hypothetical protein
MKFILTVFLCAIAMSATAQTTRAFTEDGRSVLLSPNGTWKFSEYISSFNEGLYQSPVKNFQVNYSSSDWVMQDKNKSTEANKQVFQHKSKPIYAMIISDEIPATNATLKKAINSNAEKAGRVITVLRDEPKIFGAKTGGTYRLVAEVEGSVFTFDFNYYADLSGNIQVICYTGQSLFTKYLSDCQQFINGLRIN